MAQGIVNAPGNVYLMAKAYTDETAETLQDGIDTAATAASAAQTKADEAYDLADAANTTVTQAYSELDSHTINDNPTDDTTSTASPSHSGTVTMVDSVTRDDAGHVLSVNTKTVTLPSDNNTDTKVTQTNTTTSANYRLLMSATASDTSLTEAARKSTNFMANPSTGVLTAPTFSGALSGNATSADTATTLGSDTVGGTAKPIYLSSGTPTACSSTVGSATKHMYMSSGTMTASSSTVGSGTKPMYMSSGTFTASSSTVDGAAKPMCLSSGTMTACSSTVGDTNTPVYMSSGTITAGDNIKNYATYVVAASDSVGAANADYVCDGTSDQSEINLAINAAYAAGGGKVVLLEGTYNIGDSNNISISPRSGVTLEGMGYGTIVKYVYNTLQGILCCNNYDVEYFRVTGIHFIRSDELSSESGLMTIGMVNSIIDHCIIEGFNYGIYDGSGSKICEYNIIANNIIIDCTYGIYGSYFKRNVISGNIIRDSTTYGIYLSSNGTYNLITGNMLCNNDISYTSSTNTATGNLITTA